MVETLSLENKWIEVCGLDLLNLLLFWIGAKQIKIDWVIVEKYDNKMQNGLSLMWSVKWLKTLSLDEWQMKDYRCPGS